MKCIHCSKDARYRDRQRHAQHCPNCGHAFAFEPKTGKPPVSDLQFRRALEDASGQGTLHFLNAQLLYALDRRMPLGRASRFIRSAGRRFMTVRPAVPLDRVAALRERWEKAHPSVAQLLIVPPNADPAPTADPPPALEPDIEDYSFQRVIVTESAALAGLLVKNNVHFDGQCAVLSMDGYPHDRFRSLVEMLQRNPKLEVYLLHDASPDGCRLGLDLRARGLFSGPEVRYIDVGLRPSQARALRLSAIKTLGSRLAPDLRALLTPKEAAWLEDGNVAEIWAVPHLQLIRTIRLAMASRGSGAQLARDSDGSGAGGGFWFYGSSDDDTQGDDFG